MAGPLRLALLDERERALFASSLPNTDVLSARCCSHSSSGSTSSAAYISFFVACTPRGPFCAMRFASATASSRTFSAGTTRLIRPNARARAASMRSPVSPISSAMAIGMTRPSRIPPPPANRPRLTSGSPNSAWSEATTRSHPSRSSRPPPTAVAFAAPTTGFAHPPRRNRRYAAVASESPEPRRPSLKSRRSIPAQNALSPVPVITIAWTAGSPSAASTPPPMPASTAWLSALRASGRLMRSTRTAPRSSTTTSSVDTVAILMS